MKRNWELIDSIVKTIAESDKDIFGINDFKSAETSEKEIKYTLKLMLDRGLVFDETTRYGVVQVGQLTWEGQNYYESEVSPDRQNVRKRPNQESYACSESCGLFLCRQMCRFSLRFAY